MRKIFLQFLFSNRVDISATFCASEKKRYENMQVVGIQSIETTSKRREMFLEFFTENILCILCVCC